MANKYITTLQEMLANKESMTPEKLSSFVGETMQYLQELRAQVTSKDPKHREEALNQTLELKGVLEAQMGTMGIDFARLSQLDLKNQIPDSEQEVYASTKEQFSALNPKIIKG